MVLLGFRIFLPCMRYLSVFLLFPKVPLGSFAARLYLKGKRSKSTLEDLLPLSHFRIALFVITSLEAKSTLRVAPSLLEIKARGLNSTSPPETSCLPQVWSLSHETAGDNLAVMDFSLRCNSLKCRHQLGDRAIVTTCSHIFCEPCTDSLGLAHPTSGVRVCPACETQLPNPDDVVVTQLNPTEDYKTSILSGLSPPIIMECAGRALSFYSYQTAQEMWVRDRP